MRKKSRGRFETVTDILRVIYQGVRKPHTIMSRANLSWKPMMGYLEKLIRAELVRVEETGEYDKRTSKTYYITPKGIEFLNEAKKSLATMKKIFEEEK